MYERLSLLQVDELPSVENKCVGATYVAFCFASTLFWFNILLAISALISQPDVLQVLRMLVNTWQETPAFDPPNVLTNMTSRKMMILLLTVCTGC